MKIYICEQWVFFHYSFSLTLLKKLGLRFINCKFHFDVVLVWTCKMRWADWLGFSQVICASGILLNLSFLEKSNAFWCLLVLKYFFSQFKLTCFFFFHLGTIFFFKTSSFLPSFHASFSLRFLVTKYSTQIYVI